MISISGAVSIILALIVGGVVFALLLYAVCYCEREFPGLALFWKFGRIILVLLAVFVLIGVLLNMAGGVQVFRP